MLGIKNIVTNFFVQKWFKLKNTLLKKASNIAQKIMPGKVSQVWNYDLKTTSLANYLLAGLFWVIASVKKTNSLHFTI